MTEVVIDPGAVRRRFSSLARARASLRTCTHWMIRTPQPTRRSPSPNVLWQPRRGECSVARAGPGITPNVYALDDPDTPADEALAVAERTVAAEAR